MAKEEQPMYHKLQSVIRNIVDQGYFKDEEEWKDIKKLTQKPEFRFLIGHLPCIISIYNLQKGYYEFISDNMKSIMGYDPKIFEGQDGVNRIFDLVLKDHFGEFMEPVMNDIYSYVFEHSTPENGKDFRFTVCAKLRAHNGLMQWYLMDTNILQVNALGQPLRTIFTMTNIHKFKKDEVIYYDVLKRDEQGVYRPVLQKSISESGTIHLLTEREYEILGLISKGYTSSQIADHLFISLYTAQTHRRNIKRKLQCKSNNEMINYALARGIV